MKKLSLVVPVYNAELYIGTLLSSLKHQIDNSVEVIIVNDGSSDNSELIIKKYFNKEIEAGIFKLLSQKNLGVSSARNKAISIANGEYIGFLDSDDLIYPNYVNEILSLISTHHYDIIEFGCENFKYQLDDITTSSSIFSHHNFGAFSINDVIDDIFAHSVFYTPLRVIRSDLAKQVKFPEGVKFCEDLIYLTQIYMLAGNLFNLKKVLYGYRINEQGATRNVKPEYIVAMKSYYKDLIEIRRSELISLKVNLIYIIYRCQRDLGGCVSLPLDIFFDNKLSIFKVLFKKNLPLTKKLIFISPNFYLFLFRIRRLLIG